jgi:hypothetical protein
LGRRHRLRRLHRDVHRERGQLDVEVPIRRERLDAAGEPRASRARAPTRVPGSSAGLIGLRPAGPRGGATAAGFGAACTSRRGARLGIRIVRGTARLAWAPTQDERRGKQRYPSQSTSLQDEGEFSRGRADGRFPADFRADRPRAPPTSEGVVARTVTSLSRIGCPRVAPPTTRRLLSPVSPARSARCLR